MSVFDCSLRESRVHVLGHADAVYIGDAIRVTVYDRLRYHVMIGVLAFAGTSPISLANWRANAGQAVGLGSSQYDQAINLAGDVWQRTGGNVIFTGHSLGGGLASAAAYATGGRAITFNAAGLHSMYRNGSPGAIRAHYIRGDILTIFQRWTPFPNAAGRPIPHPGQGNPFGRHKLGQFP